MRTLVFFYRNGRLHPVLYHDFIRLTKEERQSQVMSVQIPADDGSSLDDMIARFQPEAKRMLDQRQCQS